jgi:hypothetical protein
MQKLPSIFGCVDSAFEFVTAQGFQFTPFGKIGPAYIGTASQLSKFARGVTAFCCIATVLLLVFVGVAIWARVSHHPMRFTVLGLSLATFIPWLAAYGGWAFIAPKSAHLIRVAR